MSDDKLELVGLFLVGLIMMVEFRKIGKFIVTDYFFNRVLFPPVSESLLIKIYQGICFAFGGILVLISGFKLLSS